MSKELEALEKIKEFCKVINQEKLMKEKIVEYCYLKPHIDYLNIIEKALQRLEAIYNANPSEALEDLKDLRDYLLRDRVNISSTKYYSIIEQALLKAQELEKVLEIIINKNVNVAQFKFWLKESFVTTYERYKYDSEQEGWYLHLEDGIGVIDYLTEEEFELLKRWNNGL